MVPIKKILQARLIELRRYIWMWDIKLSFIHELVYEL